MQVQESKNLDEFIECGKSQGNHEVLDDTKYKTVEDLFKPISEKRKMNDSGHGIVICGHRGGAKNIHIDNTMAAFKYAIENGLEMIEFDVWLTKDDKLIITHGGDNGEMHLDLDHHDEHAPLSYIFDHTYEEIQNCHKATPSFLKSSQNDDCLIPQLHEIFDLVKIAQQGQRTKSKVCMNIEIKTPDIPEIKKRYRSEYSIKMVHDLILAYDLAEYSIIQSFNHETLKYFESVNSNFKNDPQQKINTLYLENFYWYTPLSKLDAMTKENGRGSHMQINSATEELMEEMRNANKFVGVWVDANAPKEFNQENEAFLERVYNLGIDMLTSDFPIQANNFL